MTLPSVNSGGGGVDHNGAGLGSWLHNKARHYRTFALGPYIRFQIPPGRRLVDVIEFITLTCPSILFYYILSPLLVLLASCIIALWAVTFFRIVLPRVSEKCGQNNNDESSCCFLFLMFHYVAGGFILINVIYNYYYCIRTKNHGGPSYNAVIQQLACATDFAYPVTSEEMTEFRMQLEDKMAEKKKSQQQQRRQQQQKQQQQQRSSANQQQQQQEPQQSKRSDEAHDKNNDTAENNSNNNNNIPRYRQWQLLGPFEWGFCYHTNQPKPPRAHYDQITKELVLCFDHYCPWMYNSVGYFNYRYFVNFLIYVAVGSTYLAILLHQVQNEEYSKRIRYIYNQREQAANNNNAETTRIINNDDDDGNSMNDIFYIQLSYSIFLAVGLAVSIMCMIHLFLIFTAQTTIEFQSNSLFYCSDKFFRICRQKNNKHCKLVGGWKNMYNLGWKRNWQQIYGTKNVFLALLPSKREPEFLPIPLSGDRGKRSFVSNATNSHHQEQQSLLNNNHHLNGNHNDNVEDDLEDYRDHHHQQQQRRPKKDATLTTASPKKQIELNTI